MVKQKNKKLNVFSLTLLGMFIAIMLVMNFTALGYITTGGFTVTLMTIPVALGAVCAGKMGGVVLGIMFGLTSFLQAFGIGGPMLDPMAATLFNESPLSYTIMCFVPRIVAGLVAALVFCLFEKKGKTGIAAFITSSACVPVLNTVLFMGFFATLYNQTVFGGKSVMAVIISSLTLNFVIELIATIVAASAINTAIYRYVKKLKARK